MYKTDTNSSSITDFDSVRLVVASDDDVLEWSHGEVMKPETINYRTQKPERDGLFCEKIFGPVKDINRHDSKFKGVRSREVAVDKSGDIVTKSIVRRERMGHIKLAAPVTHIWFLRGVPSPLSLILGMTVKNIEKVVYFAHYLIISVDEEAVEAFAQDQEAQYEAAKEEIKAKYEKKAEESEGEAVIKQLAAEQTKELEELGANYLAVKEQVDSLVANALLGEGDYRELHASLRKAIKVGMGAQAIEEVLKIINLDELVSSLQEEAETAKGQKLKKAIKRLKVLESIQQAGIKPESLIMNVLPVIPPDLRPMVQLTGGRFATSDLNDLYRRVINRNNRLKKLNDLRAPEVIKRNEMRMLQEAVDALVDNNNARSGRAVSATGGRRKLKSLSDQLKGKQGRFRQNLLGKRVDYSGRSVIVAGPELNINQCGMPKMMALELFKPYVMSILIANDHAHNIKSATRLIESGVGVVWDALDQAIDGKYVLLNRAPTLHRLGIQAFKPILIEGKAIQLHPLVCKGFNADFDGDQMAVHLPLSVASQKEAAELMASDKNLLKPADGSSILSLEYDIVLGCYFMTLDNSEKEAVPFASAQMAISAYDNNYVSLHQKISVRVKEGDEERTETTVGRLLFNEVLPQDFPYQNVLADKKFLKKLISEIYEQYGQDKTAVIADSLKEIGFEYATQSGVSVGMDDYHELENIEELLEIGDKKAAKVQEQFDNGLITNEERYRLTVEVWNNVRDEVIADLEEQFSHDHTSATAITFKSGARGKINNLQQMAAWVGVLADTTGRTIELPIKSNYKHGLTSLESFTSTRGTRKGMISTALKTADSGYLTRRLVDVAQDVFSDETECDDPGFTISKQESAETGVDFENRIAGRFAAETIKVDGETVVKKGGAITSDKATTIANADSIEEIKIMSVLTCTNLRGVHPKSYGFDLATGEVVEPNQPIGVIAAQSIGEPGTQLTLDVFHSGGVAGDDISQGLPRVDELLEARSPKGRAYISEIDGVATIWEVGETYVVQITPTDAKTKVIELGDNQAAVKSGTSVAKGDVIAKVSGKKKDITAPFDGVVDVFDNEIVITEGVKRTARYEIPGFKQLTVEDGEQVKKGQRLTNGSLDLRELMDLKGVEETQRYIMNQVSVIFAAQGQEIADKHLEIIVRQMFSRVQVEDGGDTEFATGDIVSKAVLLETNKELKKQGKEPAQYKQLLLGITKVSIWSDSFLSAASFQDTTRVLINAAISGRVDNLYGLKENVIIGRKIPVGTGVLQDDDDDDDDSEEDYRG